MFRKLRQTKARLLLVLTVVVIACGACFTTIRTVNKEEEQAKSERLVARFHELYNDSKFEEIYGLLDDSVRPEVNKEEFLSALSQTYAKWGKVRDSRVSDSKVFFDRPVQVRAIYNVNYEKGQGQAWFVANIRGKEARLVHFTNAEGFDKGLTEDVSKD